MCINPSNFQIAIREMMALGASSRGDMFHDMLVTDCFFQIITKQANDYDWVSHLFLVRETGIKASSRHPPITLSALPLRLLDLHIQLRWTNILVHWPVLLLSSVTLSHSGR